MMGSMMMGSAKHTGNAPLMTPEQMEVLMQSLQGLGPEANQAIMNLLGGGQMGQDQMQDIFQQSFVDPAMMNFEQQTLPAIQQRFVDANAGSSSALNQALGQSAVDLNTMLGGQMGNFMMGQQQLNQQGQLGALGAVQGMLGQQAHQPMIQQRQGFAGPLISAAGQIGGAAAGRAG